MERMYLDVMITWKEILEYAAANKEKTCYLQYPAGTIKYMDGSIIEFESVEKGIVNLCMKKSDFCLNLKYDYTKDQWSPSFEDLPLQFSDMARTMTAAFRSVMLMRIYEKDVAEQRIFSNKDPHRSPSSGSIHGNLRENKIRPWVKKEYNKSDKHINWTRPSYQVFVPGHFIHKGSPNERFVEGHYRYLELPRLDNVQKFYLSKS